MKFPNLFAGVHCDTLEWHQAVMPDGSTKGIRYASAIDGGHGLPFVHISRYDPHWTEARHRHVEDEVLILTQGELEVEGNVYRAPAALFVGRHTLYGPLTAGSEGATFYRVAYNEKLITRD